MEDELLKLTFQNITHPEDLEPDLHLVGELLAGNRDQYRMEKRYISKSGNIVWVILSVSLVKNDLGEPIHFVSQIHDIPERKTLLETIQDQNRRLLNFAYIVSHNLKSHASNFADLLVLMKMEDPAANGNSFFPMLEMASGNLKETIAHLCFFNKYPYYPVFCINHYHVFYYSLNEMVNPWHDLFPEVYRLS